MFFSFLEVVSLTLLEKIIPFSGIKQPHGVMSNILIYENDIWEIYLKYFIINNIINV